MKIAISGSSGFIGKSLTDRFTEKKIEVISIKRDDFLLNIQDLSKKIEGVDVIINLAGAPIAARWNQSYKQLLVSSRIETTKKLVAAINHLNVKPNLFISTSAIGIYNNVDIHTEQSVNYGNNFLSELCMNWEHEALKAEIRTVIFRLSVVLDKNEGALPKMLFPFKLGLGGKIGNGKQHFSWIAIEDLINIYFFIIERKDLSGIFNLASPQPINNIELTNTIGKALKKPTIFKVPIFILKLLYGEGAGVITEGQAVVPEKLLNNGFIFRCDTIQKYFNSFYKINT